MLHHIGEQKNSIGTNVKFCYNGTNFRICYLNLLHPTEPLERILEFAQLNPIALLEQIVPFEQILEFVQLDPTLPLELKKIIPLEQKCVLI